MANITLGQLRDLWNAVSDWVTGVTTSKPAVRAADIEALIGALNAAAVTNPALSASQIALLKGLLTKLQDPASETTLAAILAKLIANPATEATLAALAAEDFATETTLAAIRDTAGVKKILDPVDVADRAARLVGKVTVDGNSAIETTHQNAAVAVGDGTPAVITGYGVARFEVSGIFVGTITFEASVDGVNFSALPALDSNGSRQTTAAAPGVFRADVAGYKQVRARVSAYTSGSITVKSMALPLALPAQLSATLSGSLVDQVAVTTSPLGTGATFSGAWQENSDGRAVGLLIDADTLVTVIFQVARDLSGAGATSAFHWYRVTLDGATNPALAVPVRVPGRFYRWQVINPTGTAQTRLNVQEIRQYGGVHHSQNINVELVRNLAIRNTGGHDPNSDPQFSFVCDIGLLGDGTHPIFVQNGLDQQISVSIFFLGRSGLGGSLGNFTVASGASVLKTNFDFPGLDVPTQRLYLLLTASVAPTTGDADAYTIVSMGG